MKKIIDKFTNLPISGQMKYYYRNSKREKEEHRIWVINNPKKAQLINNKSRNRKSRKWICKECFHQLRLNYECLCHCHAELYAYYRKQNAEYEK